MILDLYEQAWRPVGAILRRSGAGAAHDLALDLLRLGDGLPLATAAANAARRLALPQRRTLVGGVVLPQPLIVAAGLVKGEGFDDEWGATRAVAEHRDIIPGWRSLPSLLGPVDFGSFTRYPRTGNAGRVVWRDDAGHAMQNRVGLRNPGAAAAATFLHRKGTDLPRRWGVNLAPTPGLVNPEAIAADADASAAFFVDAFERHPRPPSWYTLNISCPNTEDDPEARQTDHITRLVTARLVRRVSGRPVWVKVGPGLDARQYGAIARAAADAGARAIVATNTIARPAPGGRGEAGVSGAPLRDFALDAVGHLAAAIDCDDLGLDIIGSGGIHHGRDLQAFRDAGARAAMLYSALVFRGPLAPALILREADRLARRVSPARIGPTPAPAGHG